MKLITLILALALAGTANAQAPTPQPGDAKTTPAPQQRQRGASELLQQKISPGLAKYTDEVLFGEVWPGAGLSQRDRSLVVISILIATNKPAQLPGHLARALTNGVTPVEASGVLAHLALYSGWPNAVSTLEVYDKVYTERKIDFAAIQAAATLAPLAPVASDKTVTEAVTSQFATVAPKFADLSNRVVFGDLWQRPDLSMRDRSLVTIAGLAAMGDDDLLEPYLRRGVEAGLTRDEIAEALTQLAFYAGWSKATKAMTVVTQTLGNATSR